MKRLEVGFRKKYQDARAKNLREKIAQLGFSIKDVKIMDVYLLDLPLSEHEANEVKERIFTDPVTQKGSYSQLDGEFDWDWLVIVGFLPGVKDNEGKRSKRAMEEYLGKELEGDVYTAKQYLFQADFGREDVQKIARDLLSNKVIHRVEIYSRKEFEKQGLETTPPRIGTSRQVQVQKFDLTMVSTEKLFSISKDRSLALSRQDIKVIKNHFQKDSVIRERKEVGLSREITDVELEAIAQTQSEHCKHKIFNAKITYKNREKEETEIIDSLFDTFIKRSTREIESERDWILSVFWDNAGIIDFNDEFAVSMKFETHNSPSAKEPFGGAMTGIVGVYRDVMGVGKGSRPIAGSYGYCTPSPFYSGYLNPEILPRRLLEGIVEGVRDGGNKSGIPTIYGYSKYDPSFLGKPLVYVGSIGIIPKRINGEKSWEKDLSKDDLIVTVGGRVGKDGIHGVTQASQEFGESITSQHVQIGDPYTQKKVHDFLMEARDKGFYTFIWDLGGGGLSSAIGETARFSGGCEIHLDKVPLKYEGLDPWEILLSESQERMLLGVPPEEFSKLKKLAEKHDVRITNIGKYKDHGKFHVLWEDETVGYLDLEFMHEGFPQLELEAVWDPTREEEPTLSKVNQHEDVLKKMLARDNIASKEWIQRQYDHEVQGTSVIKPLVGKGNDIKSDAAVIKPLYNSQEGLALSLGNKFKYSQIDTYWMAACALDEAIRRVLSVGASLEKICLNDNFCWPNSIYDPETNPDGKEKLGKLVRANKALYKFTKAFKTPCISGKDSMFIDGWLEDDEGATHKVSGLPSLQFATLGKVKNIEKCITLTPKMPGDVVYIIGETRNELGASEYYEMRGEIGENVPKVEAKPAYQIYKNITKAIDEELLESCTGCYRGGLAIALTKKAMAGNLGLKINLSEVPTEVKRNDTVLYSETPSRFVVTVKPENTQELEKILDVVPAARIGTVTSNKQLVVNGIKGEKIIDFPLRELEKTYKETFGDF